MILDEAMRKFVLTAMGSGRGGGISSAIFEVEENVLAGVVAQDDVEDAAGYGQAGFARHSGMKVERRAVCK